MAPRSSESSDATKAASRARILEAARTLFAERGFAACRVADVARRAGMSPGNVYWHFDSKESLLRQILAEGFAGREAMAAQVADEYGPARRKLDILVDALVARYDRDAAFTVILGGLGGEGGQQLIRSLGLDPVATDARYRTSLRRVLAEARSEGAVVAASDPDQAVTCLLALFDGLLVGHPGRWSTIPRDVLRDAALRVIGYRPAA